MGSAEPMNSIFDSSVEDVSMDHMYGTALSQRSTATEMVSMGPMNSVFDSSVADIPLGNIK